jgi:uncharacterized membrane protein YesL
MNTGETAQSAENSLLIQVFSNRSAMKILLVVMLLLIVASLFSGLFFMYRDKGDSKRMVTALTIRVALSIVVFLIAIGGFVFGWFPRG